MMDIDEEPEERTKCQVCISGCKTLTKFILSHVGLLTLVVGYCVIGAFTFEALEASNEIKEKEKMKAVRLNVSNYLWNMTKATSLIVPEKWAENATLRLQEFERDLIHAIKKDGWDGNESKEQLNWTFTGALFYSIIVITTIGYGHIAPKTVWGKIVTILYAIVGIPLMVICWSHIGDFMAKSFRLIYWKVCCYICTRRPPRRARSRMRRGKSVRAPAGGTIRMKQRTIRRSARISQRSADSAVSDSAISTLSEPGMTRNYRRTNSGTIPRTSQPRSIHGPPYHKRSTKSAEPEFGPGSPILYNKYAEDLVMETKDEDPTSGTISNHRSSRNRSVPPELMSPSEPDFDYWDDYYDDYNESDYDEENIGKRPVPIWLCTALVVGYIVGGAFLFAKWEDWSLLDSAYFSFITLTTIGFGDFVPTQKSEVSIALCSLYLLFGIALLAMSFNLVQEQVISAVKELALNLGILDDEDDH